MEVDCSLVISEGTWQAVATGPHQGWDCSLMHESLYSDREEVPKMSEDILHNKSKSFLSSKHEIPTKGRVLWVNNYPGAAYSPRLSISLNQWL